MVSARCLAGRAMPLPEIRTVDDLRSALSRYGFPGDRERFEEELAAAVGGSSTSDSSGAAAGKRSDCGYRAYCGAGYSQRMSRISTFQYAGCQ